MRACGNRGREADPRLVGGCRAGAGAGCEPRHEGRTEEAGARARQRAHGWADEHTAGPQAAATHQHGEWQARPQARGNASSPSSKALDACLIKSSRSRALGPS